MPGILDFFTKGLYGHFGQYFESLSVLTGIQVRSEMNIMSRKPLVHSIMPVNFKHWHNILETL